MASKNLFAALPVPYQGVRTDLDERSLPPSACQDAKNVLVLTGALRPRPAMDFINIGSAPSERPTSIFQYDNNVETGAIVMATTEGWYYYDQPNDVWINLTEAGNGLSGAAEAMTVFRKFETRGITLLVGTNGVDIPKKWNGTATDYSDLGSEAPPCIAFVASANRLVAIGLATDPYGVDVSAFNDPTSGWGTVQQSLLGDTPGPITAGLELTANEHVIFKSDAIYHGVAQAEFYGVAAPFRYETRATDIQGPVSPLSLARLPGGYIAYLGQDGTVYLYDGSRPREVGRHIRRWISDTWNYDKRGHAWLSYDPDKRILWVWYPHSSGGLQKGIALATDVAEEWPLWPVELPAGWEFSAGGNIRLGTSMLIGDDLTDTIGDADGILSIGSNDSFESAMIGCRVAGTIYKQQWADSGSYVDDPDGDAQNAVDISWNFTTGYSSLGAADRWKTVHETTHILDSQSGEDTSVTLTGSSFAGDETASGPVTLNSAVSYLKTSFRLTARWFKLTMSGTITRLFTWDGAQAVFRMRGRR